VGKRGKTLEKAVEKLLAELNSLNLEFAWHRYPDTRAARGMIKAQPCDYLLACGRAWHLEVKETHHDFRLPRDKLSQLPTLQKFAAAGLGFGVIVHHTTTGKYRFVERQFLDIPTGHLHGSWNLRGCYEHDDLQSALLYSGWFPKNFIWPRRAGWKPATLMS
jgi:hypothetical protein